MSRHFALLHRRARVLRALPRLGLVLGLLAVAAALTLHSVGSSPPPAGASGSTAASTANVSSDEGRQVFLRECAWCHGGQGQGTRYGPDLKTAGGQGADFYLRTGRMPLRTPDDEAERGKPAYSDTTIDALVGYVDSLGIGPPVPEVKPGDLQAGRRLFLSNCAACHSSSGTGAIVSGGKQAPSLYQDGPTQVAEAVRIGPGPMPGFTEKELTDEEVDSIVTYVGDLGDRQVKGGASLDQYGPIAEGLFVWLVALPVLVIVIRLLGKKAKR